MMKRIFKLRSLALLLLALSITACKKGCDEPPVNACEGKTAFKADFRMYSISSNTIDTIPIPTMMDTVYVGDPDQFSGDVIFEAVGTYDSVKWKVGTDTRIFTSLKFKLRFDDMQIPDDIDIVFIGYRKPELACFPNDDGVDTVKRSFPVLPISTGYSPLLGRYLINEENSTRPDTAFICALTAYSGPDRRGYYLSNFPKGSVGIDQPNASGYAVGIGEYAVLCGKTFSIRTTYGFNPEPTRTFAWLDKNRKLTIEVQYGLAPFTAVRIRKWIGIPQN